MSVDDSLKREIIRRYYGSPGRYSSVDELPLSQSIEVYLLSLALDDYSVVEPNSTLWSLSKRDRELLRLKVVVKLEKALEEFMGYLRLLKANPEDVELVEECKDRLVVKVLGAGGDAGRSGRRRSILEKIVKECYETIRRVECKYFSSNIHKCLSRYFHGVEVPGSKRRRRRRQTSIEIVPVVDVDAL